MTRLAVVVITTTVAAGCGYHLAGEGGTLPDGVRTIAIQPFRNRTREHGLEVQLQRAVEDEFRRRGRLRVVLDPEGDLVLSGEIRSVTSIPVAFSGTDEAVQYQGTMQVSMRVVDRASGQTIYENKTLQETQDFGAVSGVVIQSSPRIQRGTIDARDLANLNNVQLGVSRRHDAIRGLLDATARDLYRQTVEGF